MMAKIRSGQGFAGLVDYANDLKNKDTKIIASEGVDLTSNKSIVASFSLQTKSRPSLKNFVGHISLSFAPEDTPKMTDKLMSEITKEYMRCMGIVNTQFVVCRHHDKPHAHVHIVYNRVDNDGNAITGDQGFRKSARITQALTREYGLTFGKDKKKVNRHRLKGKDAVKYRIYDAVNDALKVCIDWKELKEYLSEKGITLDITSKTDGRIKGVVFTCDNISFGGYRIDRSMTYRSLDRRLNAERGLVFADSPAVSASLSDWIRQRTDDTDGQIHRQEPTSESTNGLVGTDSSSDSGFSPTSNIGEAVVELVMQPHITPASGGGGGGNDNDRGWRDDDKEKEHIPYKRRR